VLQPWLRGERPLTEAKQASIRDDLTDLFHHFFLHRAGFVGDHARDGESLQDLNKLLANRLFRYKAALGPLAAYQEFEQRFQAALQTGDTTAEGQAWQHLTQLPQHLRDRNRDAALADLQALADSRLVRVCRTANYSYHFHKKLVRSIWGGQAGLTDQLGQLPDDLPKYHVLLAETENETNRSLRAETEPRLGILQRAINLETA
jgi:hypothetical protein